MAKYPFLIRAINFPPQWKDYEAADMTAAMAIADSIETSGVVIEKDDKNVKLTAAGISVIEIYEP